MIARLWHGTTLAENADAYLAFLQSRAVPDYRSVPGNLSVDILHRGVGYVTHFLIITHWESEAAIAAFAGDDITQAKYYPEDRGFLLEFEPQVQHYALEPG
ncbi:MAG: antibiotic biosynthesis monooxygenase [Lysobacteraceae bacterium]|nr:MAG: antibiotic biosynthesis monooxygenase [Xanthomonadaceae bacterium]